MADILNEIIQQQEIERQVLKDRLDARREAGMQKWRVEKLALGEYANYGDTIVRDDEGDICLMFNGRSAQDHDESARLIAEAPAMFALIKRAIPAIEKGDNLPIEDFHSILNEMFYLVERVEKSS